MANAVSKVPSGFHAAAKGPLKLAGADAFLGRAKQMDGLEPQPKRQMAVLKDRAHPHGEGLAALVALAQARTSGLALKAADLGRIGVTAMGANRTIRPKVRFDVLESSVFAVETVSGKYRVRHGLPRFVEANLRLCLGMSSETSPKNIP